MRELLQPRARRHLRRSAPCGAGGPGLWMAQQTGASLIGADPSAAGLAGRPEPEHVASLADRSSFQPGHLRADQPSRAGAVDAAMSVDAFQYAPGKRAALAEFFRILRPGGRVAIIAFEVDPAKVAGVPVLGADPVPDYVPLLEAAGFGRRGIRGNAGMARASDRGIRRHRRPRATRSPQRWASAPPSARSPKRCSPSRCSPIPGGVLAVARRPDAERQVKAEGPIEIDRSTRPLRARESADKYCDVAV